MWKCRAQRNSDGCEEEEDEGEKRSSELHSACREKYACGVPDSSF
jgi:hypothetical protein